MAAIFECPLPVWLHSIRICPNVLYPKNMGVVVGILLLSRLHSELYVVETLSGSREYN